MKVFFPIIVCFLYAALAKEPFLHFKEPVKPFISVLSPNTLKQFDQQSKEESSKFLEEEDTSSFSNSYHNYFEPFIFKEESTQEKWSHPSFSAKCMIVDDYNLYDISGATKNTYHRYSINKLYENGTENGNVTVYFNLCYDITNPAPDADEINQIFVQKENNVESVTNRIGKGNKWHFHKTENYSEIVIKVNSDSKNKIYYRLICKDKKFEFIPESSFYKENNNNGTELNITIETEEACSELDFYSVWKFVNDYQGLFATILAIFGLFICFAGQKYVKITSFILTVFVVAFLVIFFSQFILPAGCKEWIIWVVLFFAVVLGGVAGYFVYKYHEKVFSLLVGGFAGFFLGEFCYDLFGGEIDANQTLIHILFIVIAIIISVAVAFFARDFIIIISTSFIGAYATIRAISIFAGGFPSEFTVMDLKDNDEDDQLRDLLTWKVYVYLAFIVILCGIGIYLQFKLNKKRKEKEREEKENRDENLS